MAVSTVGPNPNRVTPVTTQPSSASAPVTPRPATPVSAQDTFEAAARPGALPNLAAPQASPVAETSGTQPGAPDRNGVPWISQLTPDGAAESYLGGEFNCGPATFAMAARKNGWSSELSDADLIAKLAEVGKTQPETGTSMNGAIAMAHAIGLPVDKSEVKYPGFDAGWVDSQLSAGKSIVANGALETPEGPSPHFLLVTGKDDAGNYQINDPWSEERRTLSAPQLQAFLERNPVHHGASIALG